MKMLCAFIAAWDFKTAGSERIFTSCPERTGWSWHGKQTADEQWHGYNSLLNRIAFGVIIGLWDFKAAQRPLPFKSKPCEQVGLRCPGGYILWVAPESVICQNGKRLARRLLAVP